MSPRRCGNGRTVNARRRCRHLTRSVLALDTGLLVGVTLAMSATPSLAASPPVVTLSPSSTGPVTTTVRVIVTGCPAGPIRITDTINGGSQTIKHNRAPATVVSQGTPGHYSVTAHCANGMTGHATFVVTRASRPVVKLSPASSGPVTTTVQVSVSGCAPGSIRITDTINGGSQTIKHNGAPATVVSQGIPGTYSVTARCSDGVTGHAQFVVTPTGSVHAGDGSTSAGNNNTLTEIGVGLILFGAVNSAYLCLRVRRRPRASG